MNFNRRDVVGLTAAAGGSLLLPRMATAQGNNVDAPVPVLTSADQLPPERSTPIVLSSRPDRRMKIAANSDNSGKFCYVDDRPGVGTWPRDGVLVKYWDGGPPANYVMTMRQYWRMMDNSYTTVPEGNALSTTFNHSWGISQTDAESISATLGYSAGDAGGVNASITATYSHSVTTDSATSVQINRTIAPPNAGMVRVWLMWQLVHEIVALGPDGRIISAGGGDQGHGPNNREADIKWAGVIPAMSGAWVYYDRARFTFPSRIIRPWQRDFAV